MRSLLLSLSFCCLTWHLPVASAGFFSDRAVFNGSAGSTTTDTFESPDHSLFTATGADIQLFPVGMFTYSSGGLTHESIQYVGNINPFYYTNYNGAFPSLNETYLYDIPGSIYSLNGTANLIAGRDSVDLYLPPGTTVFGTDIGFDLGSTSLYSGTPLSAATMNVTIDLSGGGSITTSIHVDGTSRFFGYIGSEISNIHFQSLLPTQNPTFIYNGLPGYYSYTLLDNVTLNTASTVPEPSSLALCALGVLGLGWFTRKNSTDKSRLADVTDRSRVYS